MSGIEAIVLGIVEGLTEFLPISSTGHLTLVSHFLGIVQNDQFITFEIAIQLGAILAVVFFFWKKFFNIELLTKLFIAFLPTAVIGLFVYGYVKELLKSELTVVISLILGGVILILIEKWYKADLVQANIPETKKISYTQAIIMGLAQSVAMIPGVSRSGAIIVSGLLMRIERTALVEFTFLLAVPTMLAATLYSTYKSINILSQGDYVNIALGFISSFVVALIVIKFILSYIKKYDFIPFGVYRIALGLIILFVFL
jgi:undecaprenyl-diphosphatase